MKISKVNVNGLLFNGFKFKGTPTSTIVGGKIKMRDGKILGEP